VEKDYKEALKWFTKSAEQGDAEAQFEVGFQYLIGKAVSQDKKEAVKWLTKAAEQGDERAKKAIEELKSK